MGLEVSDVMISREEINAMVSRLAKRINQDYAGKEILFVGVLNGAFVFLADLVREIEVPCQIEFMKVSSYGAGTVSSGNVRIIQDITVDIEDKHVIIVEDIIDTGHTLHKLKPMFENRKPASIALCTAFDKVDRREVNLDIDYVGQVIPDEFIVGYGLDLDGYYRNLPDIRYMENLEEE